MSITLEQRLCRHDFDDNCKCTKCGYINITERFYKKINLEQSICNHEFDENNKCKKCNKINFDNENF